jgi:ATP-dependent DNA ligase
MPRAGTRALTCLPKRTADFIEPMDCAPATKLADGLGWLFEIKLDGYRAMAVKSDRGVSLFSRRQKSFNQQYPYLVEAQAFQVVGLREDKDARSAVKEHASET